MDCFAISARRILCVSKFVVMEIICREPQRPDGGALHRLVGENRGLDVNSAYLYCLLAEHFRGTCVVAEYDETLCGFVSAYRLPHANDRLFIWQVGVSPAVRGKGIAFSMLNTLEQRPFFKDISEIQMTITPSNKASQALFHKWAEHLNSTLIQEPYLTEHDLGIHHEPEDLYRIFRVHSSNNSRKQS